MGSNKEKLNILIALLVKQQFYCAPKLLNILGAPVSFSLIVITLSYLSFP